MIKMKSRHPLLVGGEARTEFETDEQHARELELSGLAARVLVDSDDALEPIATPAVTPEPAPEPEPATSAVVAVKPKKAK